jgi:hypothetical protein
LTEFQEFHKKKFWHIEGISCSAKNIRGVSEILKTIFRILRNGWRIIRLISYGQRATSEVRKILLILLEVLWISWTLTRFSDKPKISSIFLKIVSFVQKFLNNINCIDINYQLRHYNENSHKKNSISSPYSNWKQMKCA